MNASTNHKGTGVTDSSVNLFIRAAACLSTAALTSSPRHVSFSTVFIYLLITKQRKYETTKVRKNESTKKQKYQTTRERNNKSTQQRKCETTKGWYETTRLWNNETTKQRKSDAKLQKGDAKQRDYETAKQQKRDAKQRKGDDKQRRGDAKQRNCKTTKVRKSKMALSEHNEKSCFLVIF